MKNKTCLRWLILVVATTFILSSCIAPQTNGATHKSGYDALYLQLEVDHTLAQAGKPIQMRFTVQNTSEHAWIIESPDTPVIDIVVQGEDRQVLLTWSSQNSDKMSHRIEWKSGETEIIELTWIPKQEELRVGPYYDIYVSGRLNQNSKLVQSTTIRVCASDICR